MSLHPVMAQALRPWMPMPLPTPAELDEQRQRALRRAELMDEYRTGLDKTGPQWDDEEGDHE